MLGVHKAGFRREGHYYSDHEYNVMYHILLMFVMTTPGNVLLHLNSKLPRCNNYVSIELLH